MKKAYQPQERKEYNITLDQVATKAYTAATKLVQFAKEANDSIVRMLEAYRDSGLEGALVPAYVGETLQQDLYGNQMGSNLMFAKRKGSGKSNKTYHGAKPKTNRWENKDNGTNATANESKSEKRRKAKARKEALAGKNGRKRRKGQAINHYA